MSKQNHFTVLLLLLFLVGITLVAYAPVMFDFFNGDDFVHLTWLPLAIKHPELIWKNFYSSWLDGTTTKFYRPLISVFMVSDYLLWGVNGLGFRLTNIILHLISSIFLFFVARSIYRDALGDDKRSTTVAFITSAVFALYPLHPEAVSWITGRVDSVVTTFYMASLWSFMKWRKTNSWYWVFFSLVAFILGLLSKEMAITLPALFVCYEILLGKHQQFRDLFQAQRILKSLLVTLPFWIILALYFVVRKYALGTFIGGYDDSLFFVADLKSFILNWLHALRMLVIPINKELLGAHNLFTKLWEISIAIISLSIVVKFVRVKELRPAIVFTILWLITTLVPVYKIFAIANDLQGSRLAYLATVPISMLFSFAFVWLDQLPNQNLISRSFFNKNITLPLAGILIVLAGALLWINNQAYRQAGLAVNAIRQSLSKIYSTINGDPQTLIVGLPDNIDGAYASRNALWGMTKKPQLERNIFNCLAINQFEPIFPFGYLKESIAKNQGKINLYFWSNNDATFVPIKLNAASVANTIFKQNSLKEIVDIQNNDSAKFSFDKDNNLVIESSNSTRPYIDLKFANLPCWTTDFIGLDIEQFPDSKVLDKYNGVDLLYSDNLQPEFALEHRTHSPLTDKADQTLIFALRSLPQWTLGGECKKLRLMFAPGCHLKIKSISVVDKQQILPKLHFANSDYFGTKGYLHLNKDIPQQTISVDVSKMPKATQFATEITKTNLLFEEQNCITKSLVSNKYFEQPKVKGNVVLNRSDFPGTGIYELRIWALDKDGHTTGVCSDHIVISVNP